MSDTTVDTVLVLGSTGKTGRRLVPLLADRGVAVRAASRHPEGGAADGVLPVVFDWDRPDTWAAVLDGADAVYLVGPEMVADPSDVVAAFLAAARDAGVGRAVLLSAIGVDLAEGTGLWKAEQALRSSGLSWSIVRPSWFAQNFSESFFLPGIVEGGVVAAPAGDGRVPFIDTGDIAAVAAEALLGGAVHDGAAFDITGPEALTFAEVAEIVAGAAGRPIGYVDLAPDEMAAGLAAGGVPDDYAAVLLGLFEVIRQGFAATVTTTVADVTGRPPRSFADYAAEAAPAWKV